MWNSVRTLAGCGAGGAALTAALALLSRAPLLAVTRDEYFTYLTPEGELYDKSQVPGYVYTCVYLRVHLIVLYRL